MLFIYDKMNTFSLVFSNNPRYRITRHVLFWLLWIIYFTLMYTFARLDQLSISRSLLSSFKELLVLTPIDIVHCYVIIYFLLPRYLFKGRYLMMIFLWLISTLLAIALTEPVLYYIIAPLRETAGLKRPALPSRQFVYFYNNFAFFNLQGCLAAAIKLGKMWFIKQQELGLIKLEKQKVEVPAQNDKIRPVFLINALNRIELLSAEKPAIIPGMIKKIRNLLLYVIYDNNQSRIGLKKELDLLEEYVELEKISRKEVINVSLKIIGDIHHEKIAPFIILPLVENSFQQLSVLPLAEKSIDIEIKVIEGNLAAKIAWTKPVDTAALANGINSFLNNLRKRLNLLYPESYDMKLVIETGLLVICLNIALRRAIN